MEKVELEDSIIVGKTNKEIAMHVSAVSVAVNIGLSVIKLIAGIVANSGAMISDAVHSASDVFSTVIVMVGVHLASKQSDKEHPYGHDRLECEAAIILAVLLFLTGVGIGISGIEKITSGDTSTLEVPGMLALGAAIVSIVVKELMYWYTINAAIKIKSGALMADAWHHRSDALSSIGALLGILGARMGYPILDPIASLLICVMIAKAAWEIFDDAMGKMVDTACPEKVQQEMRKVIMANAKVLSIDDLKTRLFGSKMYVEVEIGVEATLTLIEAHNIAEGVHSSIEKNFPDVKHCMVHVNPAGQE
ncbi:MAG: cation diffusion facilitator family transporter [Selenomonadaceae bacterium]|nr:cation transporter [Selenomonadaceae bacterium]MDD6397599.1 cation diffusion facilitator family transporter [Selenomonadaceae bacterium]